MCKLFFILLFAIFAISCEKEITIKLPEEPVRPTLNSFMNQDSTIAVRATLSGRSGYFGGSSEFTEPENAVVKLYENGVYVETLHDTIVYERKHFISYAKVKTGKTYKLTLDIPGYETVEGENVIPEREQIEISNKSIFYTPTEYGYDNTNFRFTITNKGSSKFNYRFRMHADSSYYVDPVTNDTLYNNYAATIAVKTQNNDLSVFGDSYVDAVIGGVYSVQALEPGESRIITLTAENIGYYSNGRFILEASLLTDDSYNYLFSLNNILKNNDDPTAERQNVICNVKNGFGIVGAWLLRKLYLNDVYRII